MEYSEFCLNKKSIEVYPVKDIVLHRLIFRHHSYMTSRFVSYIWKVNVPVCILYCEKLSLSNSTMLPSFQFVNAIR